MKALTVATLLLAFTAGSASAGNFSFTGNFNDNNEVQPFFFTVAEPSTITFKTFSSNGGTNAAGTAIPSGGFDPIIMLYDAISGRIITFKDDSPESNDTFLQRELDPGNYFAVLTEYNSFFAGFFLSEGFLGTASTHTDLHWAVDILNASSASVGVPYISPIPEPGTYAMFLAGLGLLGWRTRQRQGLLKA